MIITYIVGSFGFWLLCIAMLAVWYGVLIASGILAVTIAVVLFGIAWFITCCRGLLSSRRRAGHFG